MLIEVDLKEAKSLNLTSSQLILIKLIIKEVDIKSLLDVIPVSETDIKGLIERGILISNNGSEEVDKLSVSEDMLLVLKEKRELFDDFSAIYPTSVIRGDGTRDYLKGAPTNCRKIYKKLVGSNKEKHKHMMDAIRFETSMRMKSGNMQYMKRMYKWLTSEEWVLYEQALEEQAKKVNNGNNYGNVVE